jgi:hypothetical protein
MADNGNLKKFKKGQSGNPAGANSVHPQGRPKLVAAQIAKEHGETVDPDDPLCRPRIIRVLDELYAGAVGRGPNCPPSVRAAEEYADRYFGKPAQAVTLEATVTQKTAEQHIESILEKIGRVKADDDKPRPN